MYPDLSYFFHDLFGTQVDNWTSIFKTFGLFLALTFLVSAAILVREFIRMEKNGILGKLPVKKATDSANSWINEALANAAIGGFLAYKLPYIVQNFAEFKRDPAGILFSAGGNILLALIVIAVIGFLFYNNSKKPNQAAAFVKEWPHQKVGDIIIIAAVTGIIGSRLFSILENWETFIQDPLEQLLSGSGLTIYGGLILAGLSLVIYSKKIGVPTAHLADGAAIVLALGYGIGRMGCQFSGDGDWGIINANPKPSWFILPDWVWAYDYPRNVLGSGIPIEDCVGYYCNKLPDMVYPTPIYEIVIAILTFALLWFLRTRLPRAGMLFFVYLSLTGLARFFVEQIRVNERYDLLGLGWSLSQWLGFVFLVGGLAGLYITSRRGRKINPVETMA